MLFKSAAKAAVFAVAAVVALAAPACADQLDKIKAAGKITFATEMHYAPFDLLEKGEYRGICRGLGDIVAQELGVKAEYMDLPWTSVLPGLEVGKFDMTNAPVTITKQRMERYAFTLPISEATVGLAKSAKDTSINKPEDIAGKTVGAQKGSHDLDELKAFAGKLKDVKIKEYASVDEAYADLVAGRIDAVANGAPLNGYVVSLRPDTFALVNPPFGEKAYFAWAARKGPDSARLVAEIDRIFNLIKDDGRLAKIQTKWLGRRSRLPREFPTPQ
ncbi:MAG: transporter substrate-binding domain-containing protein [Rhodoblastus sp.]|nr:MAG: transporter substrate-binding domain-containing protein [Rhodoblastus sp.]